MTKLLIVLVTIVRNIHNSMIPIQAPQEYFNIRPLACPPHQKNKLNTYWSLRSKKTQINHALLLTIKTCNWLVVEQDIARDKLWGSLLVLHASKELAQCR